MGLFSKKTRRYSSASISRMIENKDIKDLHQAAILDYTLTNNDRVDALATSFNDVYARQVASSMGTNALRMSKWAETKYFYGVPKGYNIKKDKLDLVSIAEDYLVRLTGKLPAVDYAKLGPLNNNHAVFQLLQDQFEYSFETNKLIVNGVEVYLKNFVINYCKATVEDTLNLEFLNPLGPSSQQGYLPNRPKNALASHIPWVTNATTDKDFVEVTTTTYDKLGVETELKLSMYFDMYENSGARPELGEEVQDEDNPDYFMLSYITDGSRKFVTARYDLGDIPEIDKAITSDVDPGRYMPIIHVYRSGRLENAKHLLEGEAYKTSVKLCREMRLNYDELIDNLYKSFAGQEDVKGCYITFRLAVNDFSDPIIQEYMYNYFYELYKDSDTPTRSSYADELAYQVQTQAKAGRSIYLGDAVASSVMSYNSIGTKLVKGSIGKVGYCTGAITTSRYGSSRNGVFSSISSVKNHVFKKQITEDTYREIVVSGLNATYNIEGGGSVSASGNDGNLIIPLDVDIAIKRMGRHKQDLVVKSMHVVCTAYKEVKEKWYQTTLFKIVMFIIAIVLTIVFPPAGIAAYSAMAVAYAVAIAVVVTVAITLVSKLLYALGIQNGIVMAIIAVIAIIVGAYAAAGNGTVAGLTANNMLSIANVSFAISNNLSAMQMEARYKAYLDYTDRIDQELEDIEQRKKDLGLDLYTGFDMFELLAPSVYKPDIRLGESPLSFLNRVTAITTSIDTVMEIIPNYVFIATQLPTFEDKLRGRSSYGT